MLVPQLTRPQSQFNAEQSNQMARHHPPPCVCSPQQYSKMPGNQPVILSKESTATKDVGTTVNKTTIPV